MLLRHDDAMEAAANLLTLDQFLPIIGKVFAAGTAPDQPGYALVDARPLPIHDYPGRQRDAFVLTFRANTPEPAQGVRVFDLPGIGPTEIFLVPVEQADGTMIYEAVFA